MNSNTRAIYALDDRTDGLDADCLPCACGCGSLARPGKLYRQGHDQRHEGQIKRAQLMTTLRIGDTYGSRTVTYLDYETCEVWWINQSGKGSVGDVLAFGRYVKSLTE